MRQDLFLSIRQDPLLHEYIRMHPYWYRKLGRNPESVTEFRYEAKQFFGKTIPQRIEKLNQNLQMAMMLMQMFQSNFHNYQYGEG